MARSTFRGNRGPAIRRESGNKRAAQVDQQRIDIVLQQMDIAAIDVLICRLPQNVLMLAGCWPATGNSFVVFPRLGEPALLVSIEESDFAREGWIADIRTFAVPASSTVEDAIRPIIRDIAWEKGLQKLVVGYEGSLEDIGCSHEFISAPGGATYQMLRSIFPAADFHDASEMLDAAQMVKTPREIAAIKIATEIAELGLKAASQSIAAGVRESEIVGAVYRDVLARGTGFKGVSRVQVFSRAIAGVRSTEAHRRLLPTSDREVRQGDAILVEIEICADGFWSKLARTFFAGTPSPRLQDAYDVCLDAQRKAVEAIGGGVKAGEVDAAVRAYVANRGYGEAFKARLGHGIGFTISPKSRPRFFAGSEDALQPYVAHTLEPALYVEGLAGVKVCDVVADLGRGVEYL